MGNARAGVGSSPRVPPTLHDGTKPGMHLLLGSKDPNYAQEALT